MDTNIIIIKEFHLNENYNYSKQRYFWTANNFCDFSTFQRFRYYFCIATFIIFYENTPFDQFEQTLSEIIKLFLREKHKIHTKKKNTTSLKNFVIKKLFQEIIILGFLVS